MKTSPSIPFIRKSGHYVKAKLGLTLPKSEAALLKERGIEIQTAGVRHTLAEDRLMTAIYTLLHEKSEHQDQESTDFYFGNGGHITVTIGNVTFRSAVLRITPAELYRAYRGGGCDYSGKDTQTVRNALLGLATKKYQLIFTRKREGFEDVILEYRSLIEIQEYFEGLSPEHPAPQKTELIIALHPILTDQIMNDYIQYPADIERMTDIVSSGGRRSISIRTIAFRDYLLRKLAYKDYRFIISLKTLLSILNLPENYRAAALKRNLIAARDLCQELGLLNAISKIQMDTNEVGYRIELNKEFGQAYQKKRAAHADKFVRKHASQTSTVQLAHK